MLIITLAHARFSNDTSLLNTYVSTFHKEPVIP